MKFFFALLSAIFHSVVCAAGPFVYVVKPGDTSSTIAQWHIGKPIFTKDGSLSKLLQWNPHIKDADLIFVGQVLTIDSSSPQAPENTPRDLSSSDSSENVPNDAPTPLQDPAPKPFHLPTEVACSFEPKKPIEFWLWLGGGMNFQYYKQTIPGVSGEAVFQNVQGPTVLVQAGYQGKTLGLDLSYKETPGKMASSDTITVTNGNYSWRTLSAEGLYRKDDNWNLRTGFQHHSMPFMSLDATTAIIDVKSNTLTMLTLGFDRNFDLSNRLRGEWKMRYQHPLISGSVDSTPFSVTPKFAFDGSVGGVYSLSTNSRVGLYWYGQWHEYGFSYGRGVNEFSGSQTLFYSNIEIRLGLEF